MEKFKKSVDDSLSLIGTIFLMIIILSFFIQDSSLFHDCRIFIIVIFLGRTMVNLYRARKK